MKAIITFIDMFGCPSTKEVEGANRGEIDEKAKDMEKLHRVIVFSVLPIIGEED